MTTTLLGLGNLCEGGSPTAVVTASNMCGPGLCCMTAYQAENDVVAISTQDKLCVPVSKPRTAVVFKLQSGMPASTRMFTVATGTTVYTTA